MTNNQNYKWKRFWYPRSENVHLDFEGYLFDPENEFGLVYNPNVVPFESIDEYKCLILLGEPGIGKTKAMETYKDAINRKVTKEGGQVLWMDLRSYGSEDRLEKAIFESEAFQFHVKQKSKLYIFLDSLDECLIRIDNAVTLLIDNLKKSPVDDVYLRITCRTADWPELLELELRNIYKPENFKTYILAPLRKKDIIEAVLSNDLNPNEFLEELQQKNVVPFAIKPITLKMLINLYKKNRNLPSTKNDLYYQGCLTLCEETNYSRRGYNQKNKLSAEQRLALAARIAAITIFSNRYAVWTGLDFGNVPDEDVRVKELCGGKELLEEVEIIVNEDSIKDVLGTGLFSSRGLNRIGWAHQTYAEYLAFYYIMKYKASISQIKSLIIHPLLNKVVPQLYEIVVWLASSNKEVFLEIMKTDPEILIKCDLKDINDDIKFDLTQAFLNLYEQEIIVDYYKNYNFFQNLNHSNLESQLREYIINPKKPELVRNVSIIIANACQMKSLQKEIVHLAINNEESYDIRDHAAMFISNVGDYDTKLLLKPLIIDNSKEDPYQQLKGYALNAVWPNGLTVKELFAVLTNPNPNFSGSYSRFLRNELIENLRPCDLPYALQWIDRPVANYQLSHPIDNVADSIMYKAWQNIEEPGVLDLFAKITSHRLKHHEEIVSSYTIPNFKDELYQNEELRHQIIEVLLPVLEIENINPFMLILSKPPLVLNADIFWLIDLIQKTTSQEHQRIIAKIIKGIFDINNCDQINLIESICQINSILFQEFLYFLEPIELNSDKAKDLKEEYLESKRWQENRPKKRKNIRKIQERMSFQLDIVEDGNYSAWIHLIHEMNLNDNGIATLHEWEPDIIKLPGWEQADSITRERIISAAKRYLPEVNPQTKNWLGTHSLSTEAIGGYKAFRLLYKEDPKYIKHFENNIWEKWIPTIIAYPIMGDSEDLECSQSIVAIAYKKIPDKIIEILEIQIDLEIREKQDIAVTKKIEHCWDSNFEDLLLSKLEFELNSLCFESLLTMLFENKSDKVIPKIKTIIQNYFSTPEDLEKTVIAVSILIQYSDDIMWSEVWSIIKKDSKFGKALISKLSSDLRFRTGRGNFFTNFKEDELSQLYIWVVQQYPDTKNNSIDIDCFKGDILDNLKKRGTLESLSSVKKIIDEYPDKIWLKQTLYDTQYNMLSNTWTPVAPQEIITMFLLKKKNPVNEGSILTKQEKEVIEDIIYSFYDLKRNQSLLNVANTLEEDSITTLLKTFVEVKLSSKNLKVTSQEHGGHTGNDTDSGRGGIGEIDLKIVNNMLPPLLVGGDFYFISA